MIGTVILGSIAGIVAGILPGVGISTVILITVPWLMNLPAIDIIAFYIAAMITSQFTGSVSAILFGVPGEISSMPTVQESARIQQFSLTNTAIAGTAIGSVLGGLLSILITFVSLASINFFYGYFNHLVQSLMMLAVLLVLTVTGNNKWFVNIGLIVLGGILSLIGYNYILDSNFLTFGNPYLEQGLPPMAIMICLFAVPVVSISFAKQLTHTVSLTNAPIQWPLLFGSGPSIARASGLGWLMGLVPGMSYAYGSTASYSAEHWFEKHKSQSQVTVNRVVAAETANNAGIVSCLIPFLIFGIPILSSEAAVYNLLKADTVLNFAWVVKHSDIIMMVMLVANIIGLLAAWPASRLLIKIVDIDYQWLKRSILTLLAVTLLYVGWENNQIWYYAAVGVILTMLGLSLRKFDTLPLVLTALFFDNIVGVLYRTWLIYS